MTNTELNALPHRSKSELDAIPSITLKFTAEAPVADFLKTATTRVFDAIETEAGWDGCQRTPRTGDFSPRQLFPHAHYELA